jgi:hypothetical protein
MVPVFQITLLDQGPGLIDQGLVVGRQIGRGIRQGIGEVHDSRCWIADMGSVKRL